MRLVDPFQVKAFEKQVGYRLTPEDIHEIEHSEFWFFVNESGDIQFINESEAIDSYRFPKDLMPETEN